MLRLMSRFLCIAIFGTLLGCGGKNVGCGGAPRSQKSTSLIALENELAEVLADVSDKPITLEEATEFGRLLENRIAAADYTSINDMFNERKMILRLAEEGGLSDEIRLSVIEGYLSDLDNINYLIEIRRNVEQGATFKMLHAEMQEGKTRVVFRILNGSELANYHIFYLYRQVDGAIKANDVYMMNYGESLTECLRGLILFQCEELHKNSDNDEVESKLDSMRLISYNYNQAHLDQQYEVAIECFKQLPLEIKKRKSFLLNTIYAAVLIDSSELNELIQFYFGLYPDDPSIDIAMMWYYIGHGNYEQAHEAINAMDALAGGDPYQQYNRSLVYFNQGKLDKALNCCEQAFAAEPELPMIYDQAVYLEVLNKEYSKAVEWLKRGAINAGPTRIKSPEILGFRDVEA